MPKRCNRRPQNREGTQRIECEGRESGSRSVRECCKSMAVARKQQLQRLGVLQECCSGHRAAVAASRSVAEALRSPRSSSRHNSSGRSSCKSRNATWQERCRGMSFCRVVAKFLRSVCRGMSCCRFVAECLRSCCRVVAGASRNRRRQ